MYTVTSSDVARFWAKIPEQPADPTACWRWGGRCEVRRGGYGVFDLRPPKKIAKTHRLAYELAFGAIPRGKHVLHRCDNPRCVRPEHLFVDTNLGNVRDRHKKGRSAKGARSGAAQHPEKMSRAGVKWLSAKRVRAIRRRSAAGESITELVRAFGKGRGTIIDIIKRRTWSDIK